ncbi:hypothetical protein [Bradyrhizobium diazoefficiens]
MSSSASFAMRASTAATPGISAILPARALGARFAWANTSPKLYRS